QDQRSGDRQAEVSRPQLARLRRRHGPSLARAAPFLRSNIVRHKSALKIHGGTMGLLDDLENKAVTGMLGGSSNPLATGLLQMINNHPGGVAGLVQSFHEKGLGEVASSWVS